MKRLIGFFLERRIFTLMLFLSFLIISVLVMFRASFEIAPFIPASSLSATVTWRDTDPETIEREVISVIEAEVSTLRGVENITSQTDRGGGTITITLSKASDPDRVLYTIKEAVKGITLPSGAYVTIRRNPAGSSYSRDPLERLFSLLNSQRDSSFMIRVSGAEITELKELARNEISTQLLSLPSIADISVTGGASEYLEVNTNPDSLLALQIPIGTVNRTLEYYRTRERQISTLTYGACPMPLYFESPETRLHNIASLRIRDGQDTMRRLEELADIEHTIRLPENRARVNGSPAVIITLNRKTSFSLIEFSSQINNSIKELGTLLPLQYQIEILSDPGLRMQAVLKDMAIRLVGSITAVFITILLFFRKMRPSILVFTALLYTLLLSSACITALGLTINLITLSGLILSAGMLVDNTLVIYECLHGLRDRVRVLEAAATVLPVIAVSSATNIVVFSPFIFLSGSLGELFRPFALTICAAMCISALVSIVFIPLMFSLGRRGEAPQVITIFGISLLLKYKYIIAPAAIAATALIFIFMAPGVWKANTNYSSYRGTREQAQVSLSFLDDASIEDAVSVSKDFEQAALDIISGSPEVNLVTEISRTRASVRLISRGNLEYDLDLNTAVQRVWQQMSGNYISVTIHVSGPEASTYGGGGTGTDSSSGYSKQIIRVTGYNYDLIKYHIHRIAVLLREVPECFAIDNGFDRTERVLFGPAFPGYDFVLHSDRPPELTPRLLQNALSMYALEGSTYSINLEGNPASLEISPENDTSFFSVYELLPKRIPGTSYAFADAGTFRPLNSPTVINRTNQKYTHDIKLAIDNVHIPGYSPYEAVENILENYELPPGFTAELQNRYFAQAEDESKEQMGLIFLAAGVLVFMVLAGHFESYTKPLFVFMAVPMALAVLIITASLYASGIGIGGILGLVVLAGIGVNDSLILIRTADINISAASFVNITNALNETVKSRFRPIIITSLTTIFALIPALITDTGNDIMLEIWKEFSFFVVIGISGSTIITLTLIPVCYGAYVEIRRRCLKC
jgi:HAE1 family hydrophobic/amphiphilic exporter-1